MRRAITGLGLLMAIGCGGTSNEQQGDGSPSGDATTAEPGVAAPSGTLLVFVEDSATSAPVSANVSVGDVSASGASAVLDVPTGRALVTVTASGYLPWHQEVPVGAINEPLRIALRPRAASQVVGAAGGTVSAGGIALEFPAGAFSGSTAVTATALDAAAVASGFGPVQFLDGDRVVRILAGLDVETASQPASPVRLRFPVAATNGRAFSLWALDDGGVFVERMEPAVVDVDGVEFEVDHFSAYGLAEEYADSVDVGSIITAVQGTPRVQPPGGASFVPTVGREIPIGSRLTTDASSSVGWRAPSGSAVVISRDADVTVDRCRDMTLCTPQAPDVRADRGTVRAGSARRPGTLNKFMIRTKTAVFGWRGTVAEIASSPCAMTERTIDDLAVYEGEVVVDPVADGSSVTVGAGAALALCDGCAPGGDIACPPCLDTDPQTFRFESAEGDGTLESCSQFVDQYVQLCGIQGVTFASEGGAVITVHKGAASWFDERSCTGGIVFQPSPTLLYEETYRFYERDGRTLEVRCTVHDAELGGHCDVVAYSVAEP